MEMGHWSNSFSLWSLEPETKRRETNKPWEEERNKRGLEEAQVYQHIHQTGNTQLQVQLHNTNRERTLGFGLPCSEGVT